MDRNCLCESCPNGPWTPTLHLSVLVVVGEGREKMTGQCLPPLVSVSTKMKTRSSWVWLLQIHPFLSSSLQAHMQSLSGSWLRADVSHRPRTPCPQLPAYSGPGSWLLPAELPSGGGLTLFFPGLDPKEEGDCVIGLSSSQSCLHCQRSFWNKL